MTAVPNARSHTRARRLRAAVASSALSKVGSVAYQVLAVPLIVASVGSDGYSQFAVVLAAFGWMGSLFSGLGLATTERIASDGIHPTTTRTRRTFMTALAVTLVLLDIIVLGGAVLLLLAPPAAPDYTPLAIAGLATALGLAGGIFDSALLGVQRSYVTNLLSFASSLVAVGATVAAAVIAPTVGAMILAILGPVVLARIVSGIVLRRVEPGIWGTIRDVQWTAAPRLVGRGLVFAAISFATFLSLDAALLIVAQRLGTTEVAEVALVLRVLPLVLSVVGMIVVPLWPAIREAAGGGDLHWIARTTPRVGLFVMGYATAAALIVAVFGDTIVGIWTGGRISLPFEIRVAAGMLIVTLSWEGLTQTMLFGLGRAADVAAVALPQSVLSIVLVYLSVGALGQAAALVGPITASLLISSWLLPALVIRAFRRTRRLHDPFTGAPSGT